MKSETFEFTLSDLITQASGKLVRYYESTQKQSGARMKNSKQLIIVTLLLLSGSVFAFDEEQSLDRKLATVKFEELQAQIMIKKLKSRGRLDEEEANMAKRAIASVKDEAIEQIRVEALDDLKSSKSVATK